MEPSAKTRRLFDAILVGIAGRGVALIAPLLLMPAMLGRIGPDAFGLWITAVSVTTTAAFLDFGIGNGLLTRLSIAFGHGDTAATRAHLANGYLLLGAIAAILLLTLAGSMAVWRAADAAGSRDHLILAIVVGAFCLTLPTGVVFRLLQARQRFVLAQMVQSSVALMAVALCLLAIRLGAGPFLTVAVYAFAQPALQALWTLWFLSRHADLRPTFGAPDATALRSLLGLGSCFFVVSIFTSIGMNADNIIIAAVAGAKAVTEFAIPAKLGSLLLLIVFTLFMPLWAFNGEALARGDRAWLMKSAITMSGLGCLAVLVTGIVLVWQSDLILQLWMGRSFSDQNLVLMGMVVSSAVIAITSPFNMILNAAGLAREQILPWMLFVALSLGAKALLLSPETAWRAPWITFMIYALVIMPSMLILSFRRVLDRMVPQ